MGQLSRRARRQVKRSIFRDTGPAQMAVIVPAAFLLVWEWDPLLQWGTVHHWLLMAITLIIVLPLAHLVRKR